jgi:glucose-6-phosphate 1-dehydrogenase
MSSDLVRPGGTGDLTGPQLLPALLPALFPAWRHGELPAGGRILALARDGLAWAEPA